MAIVEVAAEVKAVPLRNLSGLAGSAETFARCLPVESLEKIGEWSFADQFKLQGIQRCGGIKVAWILRDKNLEQPVLLLIQAIVVMDVVLQKLNRSGNTTTRI